MLHNTSGRKHWSRVHHQEPPPLRPHTSPSTVQQEAMPGRSLQFREAEVASLKTSHHLPSLLCSSPHWPGREVTHSTHLRLRNSSAVLMHIFKTLSHKTHYSAGWRHVLCGVCALSLYLYLNLHKAILNPFQGEELSYYFWIAIFPLPVPTKCNFFLRQYLHSFLLS